MSSENQKLNQMLGLVVDSYNVLKDQVIDLMIKSRKRKAGCDDCNFNRSGSGANAFTDQYCGCCSDDDSCHKRPRESSKPKVMRVLVPTPISDASLVRKGIRSVISAFVFSVTILFDCCEAEIESLVRLLSLLE